MGKPTDPLGWVAHLEGRLSNQTAVSDVFARYYDSTATNLAYAQEKFADTFGDMFVGWNDNFCPLIVDSISERLTVKGFRMGPEEAADEDAHKIWRTNGLDANSNAAHIDAMVRASSYLVVWGDAEDEPLVSPEPASQVAVQYLAGTRRTLEAALKRYTDDWGTQFSTLWLPDKVYTASMGTNGKWNLDNPHGETNPLGVVPVVPLNNRSRLLTQGVTGASGPRSELAGIIPIQDAINKISADAIVASEFAAFPQRILAGLEPFTDPNAERVAMMKAYVDRILVVDGENVSWGQFDATDLSNYVKLIDMLVQHLASRSRVPFHYFLLNGGQAPSGESITAAEAGLVAKARERMLHFGEGWVAAMRMAFKVKGDARANAWDAEVIWGDPEHRSKAALVDALLKAKELGVPDRQLQEDYGYTPSQIARFADMQATELKAQIAKQKALSAVTGAIGGSAPAGNGTPAPAGAPPKNPPKNAAVELQKAKAKAA